MNEIWITIVGYEGFYSVSSWGRVRRDKEYKSTQKGRILKPFKSPKYLRVSLSKNNKIKNIKIHHLVTEAFLGKRPKGLVVDHKDEDKFNNRVENLRYVTNNFNRWRALLKT